MEHQPPTLPVEIILMIFRELGMTLEQSTPVSWRSNPSPSFERSFKALTLVPNLAGPAREILFKTVHVGSNKRAQALLKALQRSFVHPARIDNEGKRQPAWRQEGYLKQLVKSIRVDIMAREVVGFAGWEHAQGSSGIHPSDIELLAAALPDLTTLDILCSDKGGWLDASMIRALRRFTKVKSMEIESTGYGNAHAIFSELEGLEELKLRAIPHGFVGLLPFSSANAVFLALPPRPPESIRFGEHLKTLVLQRVVLDPATTLPQLFTQSGLNPSVLENLVVAKIVAPAARFGFPAFAIPPDALQSHLQPFMANLRLFHLDLFDVPPIPDPAVRKQYKDMNLLENGRLVLPADSGHRPADFLAPSFGPHLHCLTLGGPMNLGGSNFFDQLSNSPARVKELIFSQAAEDPSSGRARDGITPEDLIASLDTEWATGLERIDITGMQEGFMDDKGDETPAWNWEAIEKIEAKLREVEQAGGLTRKRIELSHSVARPAQRNASKSSQGKEKGKGKRVTEDEPSPRKKKKSSKK